MAESEKTVHVESDITEDELAQLREAFSAGNFETVLAEHEGASWTMIFEAPGGFLGVTVGSTPLGLSINRWKKEQHHELDRMIWVRE